MWVLKRTVLMRWVFLSNQNKMFKLIYEDHLVSSDNDLVLCYENLTYQKLFYISTDFNQVCNTSLCMEMPVFSDRFTF